MAGYRWDWACYMAFVEFRDVCKTYHMGSVEVHAVAGMSFDIEEGELCVIVGPSGAGKTTVLNMLGGMDKAIPVDVYAPGCAVRPEAIIDAVVQALGILEEKSKALQAQKKGA